MANCEETPCINVQSAICLHCSRRLCAPHIIAHGTALLKEGDELCELINQLAEYLNFSLQKIDTARKEATHKLGLWRQDQIDKIEYKFAEKIQVIEFRKDHLTDLENELTQRLDKEAKQPLDHMQAQQNASSQFLQEIRQNITNIIRDSAQLDLSLKTSSSSIPNTATTNKSPLSKHQQEYDNNATQYYFNSNTSFTSNEDQRTANQYYPTAVNTSQPSNFQPLTTTQFPASQTTRIPVSYYREPTATYTAPASSFCPQATTTIRQTTVTPLASKSKPTATAIPPSTPKPTTAVVPPSQSIAAAAVLPSDSRPQSVASASSQNTIKRPPISSCRKLIKFFMNVSGSSDLELENYIIQNLHQVVHVNCMMVLLLSFLEAWNAEKSSAVSKERVLSHHINTIKKYIKGRDLELTVIAAIQVSINSSKYDETKSGEIIITLLRFFFDNKCITKETVLDWYKNGAYYGYDGFDRAKLLARLFIDQINTDVESKPT